MHYIFTISISTTSFNNYEDFIEYLLKNNNLNRMKAFELCICALAYISLTSAMTIINKIESNGNKFMNNCIIEAGMTYDEDYDVRDIINDAIDKPELEERTQKHGCFMECLLRKMNWMEGSELKEENLYTDINTIFANHTLKIQINEFIRDCVGKDKLLYL